MKKVLLAMAVVLGLTAPAGAFQWLIEMEPNEMINFCTSYGADYKAVEVTNLNLMKALVEDPELEAPQQAAFYFQWLFNMIGITEPPTQYSGGIFPALL